MIFLFLEEVFRYNTLEVVFVCLNSSGQGRLESVLFPSRHRGGVERVRRVRAAIVLVLYDNPARQEGGGGERERCTLKSFSDPSAQRDAFHLSG